MLTFARKTEIGPIPLNFQNGYLTNSPFFRQLFDWFGVKVVGEVPIQVYSPEGGAPKGMSPRVFSNLRRTHKYKKLPIAPKYALASFHCRLHFDLVLS